MALAVIGVVAVTFAETCHKSAADDSSAAAGPTGTLNASEVQQAASSVVNADTSDAARASDLASRARFHYTWTRGGFDNVMVIHFTVANPTDYAFKDFTIHCTGYAESGTHIDDNERIAYLPVRPHGSKSADEFNMGFLHPQVTSVGCAINSVVLDPIHNKAAGARRRD